METLILGRSFSVVFYSSTNPNHVHLDAVVPYGDSLFREAATTYHHALAQASLGLALSNFREKGKTAEEQGYAVRDFLTAAGFTDIQADQYDVDTTSRHWIRIPFAAIFRSSIRIRIFSVCLSGRIFAW